MLALADDVRPTVVLVRPLSGDLLAGLGPGGGVGAVVGAVVAGMTEVASPLPTSATVGEAVAGRPARAGLGAAAVPAECGLFVEETGRCGAERGRCGAEADTGKLGWARLGAKEEYRGDFGGDGDGGWA